MTLICALKKYRRCVVWLRRGPARPNFMGGLLGITGMHDIETTVAFAEPCNYCSIS